MLKDFSLALFLTGLSVLVACQAGTPAQPPADRSDETGAGAAATLEVASVAKTATCAEIEAHWDRDWPAVLEALERLIAAGEACGEEPLLSK